MSVDVRYRITATANGARDGRTRTEDGKLDLQLSTPKELGGTGGKGTNPEQLFASGYATCFLGALKFAGHQLKIQMPTDAAATAMVGIGMRSEGGFGLEVELDVALPGLRTMTPGGWSRRLTRPAPTPMPRGEMWMFASASSDLERPAAAQAFPFLGEASRPTPESTR